MNENESGGRRKRLRKLSEYCQLELMKNPRLLENVANVPYYLLEEVFKQINLEPSHLKKLEETNIFFIFEDDDLWLEFLKKEYPTNVPHSYVSNKTLIENYYMKIYERYEDRLDEYETDLFDRYVMNKLKKDIQRNKYKIPYRMLFEHYYKDAEKKKMKSAERLRESVHKLDQERKKNQTVTVDYSKFIHNNAQAKKGRRRKEFWDDRTPIKSIDKYNSSQHRNITNKTPPARIAFGGVAGRPLQKAPTVIRSPMTEMRDSRTKSMDTMTPLVRHKSNISDKDNESYSDMSKSDSDNNHSPRRKRPFPSSRRNQPTQNIFLKKRTPSRASTISTSKYPEITDTGKTDHRRNDSTMMKRSLTERTPNITIKTTSILTSNPTSTVTEPAKRSSQSTKTNSINRGTKKLSKFFHHTNTLESQPNKSLQPTKIAITRHTPSIPTNVEQPSGTKASPKHGKRLTSLKNYLTDKGIDPR